MTNKTLSALFFVIAAFLMFETTALFSGTSDADFIARHKQMGRTEKYRILVDKVFAAPNDYVITDDHIRQIAEAGFNVVSPRRGADDLERVRREAEWAQKRGIFFVTWMRGKTDAGQGPKLIWFDGTPQDDASPNSDVLWEWLTQRITGYAKVSMEVPALIGTFLDYENYHSTKSKSIVGDLYSLSYDAKILGDFAKAKGITLPELEPKQRKAWLDKQSLHDAFAEFQFEHWRQRCRKLRKAVDAINPRFQFFVYPEGPSLFLAKAAWQELSTELAPVVISAGLTYGRRSNLTPRKEALAANRQHVLDRRQTGCMFIGGIDPVWRGADPEFSAWNAVMLSEQSNGYWVFYEGPEYNTPRHREYMNWFGKANQAIVARNYQFQYAPRQTPHPLLGGHIGMKVKPCSTKAMPPEAANKGFAIRWKQSCVVLLKAGEELRGRVEVIRIRADKRPPCEFTVVDPDGRQLYHGKAEVDQSETFRVKAEKAGLYAIAVAAEKNCAKVFVENQYFCLVMPDEKLLLVGEPPRAYFTVKPDATQAEMSVRAGWRGSYDVTLLDSSGSELVRKSITSKADEIKHEVPPGQAGKTWSISATGDPFLELMVGKGCGKLLATEPTRLLVVSE